MPNRLSLFVFLASLAFCLFDAVPACAQKSPFGVAQPATEKVAPSALPASRSANPLSAAIGKFWIWVQTTQRDLHRQLASAIQKLKKGEGLTAAWLLVSLSFFYGVVHAAGPGHGKAVISSYVLANERTVRRGVVLSFLASLMQAVSAIVLVSILAVLLNAVGVQISSAARNLESASYALVTLVGAWLLFSQLRRMRYRGHSGIHASAVGNHHHAHDQADDCCGHAHMPGAQDVEQAQDWKSAAAIILAVGLRPCTGAILVLVFAFANGLYFAGVGATFAMALGTAITVSTLAILAVGSRELAVKLAGPGSRVADTVFNIAALTGAGLVLLLGVVLFAGSLTTARPF